MRRIIPARAGFTRRPRGAPRSSGDHPRSRGVYDQRVDAPVEIQGSSPLARGLPDRRPVRRRDIRIIPARAGFTRPWGAREAAASDHPRSRGVYGGVGVSHGFASGSSPLARGLQVDRGALGVTQGIIPARAGFTMTATTAVLTRSDHPRSRGVYVRVVFARSPAVGSSPLARGLRAHGGGPGRRHRIIPARAGFTRVPDIWECSRQDHPRSRGVYAGGHPPAGHDSGSSPLARGLLEGGHEPLVAGRIIPARAGFTPPRSSSSR